MSFAAARRRTYCSPKAIELARRYPAVKVEPDVLFVDNGQVLTCAGAAAGLDLRWTSSALDGSLCLRSTATARRPRVSSTSEELRATRGYDLAIESRSPAGMKVRPVRDLGSPVEVQLFQDVAHVHPGGAFVNHESLGNLPVGKTLRDERGHFALARAQQVSVAGAATWRGPDVAGPIEPEHLGANLNHDLPPLIVSFTRHSRVADDSSKLGSRARRVRQRPPGDPRRCPPGRRPIIALGSPCSTESKAMIA